MVRSLTFQDPETAVKMMLFLSMKFYVKVSHITCVSNRKIVLGGDSIKCKL